jgi:hypothetical protein
LSNLVEGIFWEAAGQGVRLVGDLELAEGVVVLASRQPPKRKRRKSSFFLTPPARIGKVQLHPVRVLMR